MRLSNGVARLENGLLFLGRTAKSAATIVAFHTKVRVGAAIIGAECKLDDFRLRHLAVQMADSNEKFARLSPVDRNEVDLQVMEISAIRDASKVRRQERALRREYAKRIINGDLPIPGLGEFTCSRPPSSPSSGSGY